MGALVELFCAIFELVARLFGQRNPQAGCFTLLLALVITGLVTFGLLQLVVWLTG